ncbi:MAG: hypothetical protein ACYC1A_03925 [Spirochaetales bacterium]
MVSALIKALCCGSPRPLALTGRGAGQRIPPVRAASFSEKSKLSIFVGYYKPHWRLFLLDLSCALGIALIDLSFPMVSR